MQFAAEEQDDPEATVRLRVVLSDGTAVTGNANGPRDNIRNPSEAISIREARP